MSQKYFELLQLNDATFPIGSYSFSWGIETFVQQEIIKNKETSMNFLLTELYESFLYSDLLAVKLSYEAAKDTEKLLYLDEVYSASRLPYEIKDGSIKLGKRFWKTVLTMKDNNYPELVYPENFCTSYGYYCAMNGFDLKDCLSTFIYSQYSARVTTCVKTIPLSQTEGQQILSGLINHFDQLITRCMELTIDDFCFSCPGLDIRAMQHEFLYSRLYSN